MPDGFDSSADGKELSLNDTLSLILEVARWAGFGTPEFKDAMELAGELLFAPMRPINPGTFVYNPTERASIRARFPNGKDGDAQFEVTLAVNGRLRAIYAAAKARQTMPTIH